MHRLKILEGLVPPVPELKVALIEVLTSILILCAISAKYIKMKRIGKDALARLLRLKFLCEDDVAKMLPLCYTMVTAHV